jgi:adenylylsulfate kinase
MNYLFPTQTKVTRDKRELLLNQRSLLLWFTGFSGAGKSTIAIQLEALLNSKGFKTYLLDGDNIRFGLNKDLSFTLEDRAENIRRIAEVSKLFIDAGFIVLSAFISPLKKDRDGVKMVVGAENYVEIFVDCPLSVCEQRDVKGLYKKARAGDLKNFTGIDSPYERPVNPDILLPTDTKNASDCADFLLEFILPQITR